MPKFPANFWTCSVRQYVYQFNKKWAVKKQGSTALLPSLPPTAPLPSLPPAKPASTTSVRRTLKRPRTLATSASNSAASSGSATSEPPLKKHEHAYRIALWDKQLDEISAGRAGLETLGHILSVSDHPDSEQLGLPHETGPKTRAAGGVQPVQKSHGCSIMSLLDAVDTTEAFDDFDPDTSTTPPSEAAHPLRPLTPVPWGASSPVRPQDMGLGSQNLEETTTEPADKLLNKAEEPGPRIIDLNRPVDTFSEQDMTDIRRAADCFAVLSCHQEAFKLYITMLKRQHSDPEHYVGCSFWYLVVQCAYTARNTEHVEVIRNIICAEIHRPTALSATHRLFLLHMLLAFLSICNGNLEEAKPNLAEAQKLARAADQTLGSFLKALPLTDRCLDLPLYHSVLRLRSWELSFSTLKVEEYTQLEDHILTRVPGPFEFQPIVGFNNPCIRSCLYWCDKHLQSFSLWREDTEAASVHDNTNNGIDLDDTNTIFIRLWQRWNDSTAEDSDPWPLWMSETQTRMGISPTQLLMVVSRMIRHSHDSWAEPASSDSDLIRRLLKRHEYMLGESEMRLGKIFLDHYVFRRPKAPRCGSRCGASRMKRSWVGYIEDTLRVRFLNIGTPSTEPQSSNNILHAFVPLSPSVNQDALHTKQVSPTLASSFSSLDLSNFRRTGASAALRLSRFAGGSGSIPSLLSVGRSRNKMSIAGLSDLSTSLKSMSISGENWQRNRASSQVSSRVVRESASSMHHEHALDGPNQELGEEELDRMSIATWMR